MQASETQDAQKFRGRLVAKFGQRFVNWRRGKRYREWLQPVLAQTRRSVFTAQLPSGAGAAGAGGIDGSLAG